MNKGCSYIILGLLCLLIVLIFVGQIIATSIINVQKSTCGLVQEGAAQIGDGSPSQIDQKCLDLVNAAIPLTRGIAVVGSFVATFFIGILIFIILSVYFQFT